jgi:acetoin utilization deacetylase AcuC-like enzyme
MKTALLTHPIFIKHAAHPGHPERPERLITLEQQLNKSPIIEHLSEITAPAATLEQIGRVHTQDYISMVESSAPQSGQALFQLDPDTAMNEFSLEATKRAAGAACKGAELVFKGDARHAFCAVRPCGHHATRDKAMGFCIYNGIAVGAAFAIAELGLERVAILDFDVHHGNGTEDIFEGTPEVLFCSSFQHPYYPYSNPTSDYDNIIKSPLPAGSGGSQFRKVVSRDWMPALETFQPQMIFISAGFDAHEADPLAQLCFTEDDYTWFSELIVEFADRVCPGQIISYLEGGYDLNATASSAIAHIAVLSAQ